MALISIDDILSQDKKESSPVAQAYNQAKTQGTIPPPIGYGGYTKESLEAATKIQGDLFKKQQEQIMEQEKLKNELGRKLEEKKAMSSLNIKEDVAKDSMMRLQRLQGLIPDLDHFDALMKTVPTATGIEGRISGIGKIVEGTLQTDPFAASVIAQADALRPQIVKGLGDVGNFNIQEQKAAIKFMPLLQDSMDTRAIKSMASLSFIRKKIVDSVEKSGLSDDENYKNVLSELDKRIEKKHLEALRLGADPKKVDEFLGIANIRKTEIPSRLSEDKIEYTMKKYKMTREAVLDAYSKKKR